MRLGGVLIIGCGICVSLMLAGCSGSRSPAAQVQDANKTNIQRLTNLYTRHQLFKAGQGPKSEQDFKTFILSADPETLKNIGVDVNAIDSLFVSERDSQPFEIRYGVVGGARISNQALVLEKSGVDGVRQVGFASMAIREISSEGEIAKLMAGEALDEGNSSGSLPAGSGK